MCRPPAFKESNFSNRWLTPPAGILSGSALCQRSEQALSGAQMFFACVESGGLSVTCTASGPVDLTGLTDGGCANASGATVSTQPTISVGSSPQSGEPGTV